MTIQESRNEVWDTTYRGVLSISTAPLEKSGLKSSMASRWVNLVESIAYID